MPGIKNFSLAAFFLPAWIFLAVFFLASCRSGTDDTSFVFRESEQGLAFSPQWEMPIDAVLILDQSGSMRGYPGFPATDPDGLSIEAAGYFVNNLAAKSVREPYNRLGIVNFGTTVVPENVAPLVSISSAPGDPGVESLRRKLKVMNLGETNFVKALEVARDEMERAGAFDRDSRPVMVIFTDGEPDDLRRLPVSSYFREIEGFVRRYLDPRDCRIYVVGIDAVDATWTKSAPYWERIIGSERVFRVDSMEELSRVYNDVIRDMFDLPAVEPEIVSSEKELAFYVPPYMARLEFHVFPEGPGLELEVRKPDGELLKAGPKTIVNTFEKYSIMTVFDPPHGEWEYRVTGQGKVKIFRNPIPLRMQLVSPERNHPLEKRMDIIASFLEPDGTPIEEVPGYPMRFSGFVTRPDGEKCLISFERSEDGIFLGRANPPLAADMPGNYQARLVVEAASVRTGRIFHSTADYTVSVTPFPYLSLESPVPGSVLNYREGLEIEAVLFLAGERIDPASYFRGMPGSLVVAGLMMSPDRRQTRRAIYLDQDEDDPAVFRGVLPVVLRRAGENVLGLKMMGETLEGDDFSATAAVDFLVRPSFVQRYLGLIFALLAIGGSGYGLYWWKLPKLKGRIIVTRKGENGEPGEPREFRLSGNRMTIGGKGARISFGSGWEGPSGYVIARPVKNEAGFIEVKPEITLGDETLVIEDGWRLQKGNFELEYRLYD